MSEDDQLQLPGALFCVSSSTASNGAASKRLHYASTTFMQGSNPTIPNWPIDTTLRTVAVGSDHLGLLFEDGRVARIKYELVKPVVEAQLSEKASVEKKAPAPDRPQPTDGSLRASTASMMRPFPSSIFSGGMQQTSARYSPQRTPAAFGVSQRIPRRHAGAFLMDGPGARRANTTVVVPDELISRVLEILPNKSRSAISRQLQKSGLDVDAAINFLLANEDDDDEQDPDEDEDDEEDDEDHEPHANEDQEDGTLDPTDPSAALEGYAIAELAGREDRYMALPPDGHHPFAAAWSSFGAATLEAMENAERSLLHPSAPDRSARWTLAAKESSSSSSSLSKSLPSSATPSGKGDNGTTPPKVATNPSPYRLLGQLEFAVNCPACASIAALHSRLLMVTVEGGIVWEWGWGEQTAQLWSRISALGLESEAVVQMQACPFKVSLVTASGKLVNAVDDSCHTSEPEEKPGATHVLEHPATAFAELAHETVVDLSVSPTTTCVRTATGNVYWWGMHPLSVRESIVKKETKRRKALSKSPTIRVGDCVQLRSCPLYRPGAIGVNPTPGEPCIGRLLDSAWNLTDKCRFQPLSSLSPPSSSSPSSTTPSSASTSSTTSSSTSTTTTTTTTSSTASTTASTPSSSIIPPSMSTSTTTTTPSSLSSSSMPPSSATEGKTSEPPIVEWRLDKLVFLRQGSTTQIGTVLKVDGPHAAVHFEDPENPLQCEGAEKEALMWKTSRLFRTDELGPLGNPKTEQDFVGTHEFVQHTPMQIHVGAFAESVATLDGKFHVLCVAKSKASVVAGDNADVDPVSTSAHPSPLQVSAYKVYAWKNDVLKVESSICLPGNRSFPSQKICFDVSTSTSSRMILNTEGSLVSDVPVQASARPFGIRPQYTDVPSFRSIATGHTMLQLDDTCVPVEIAVVLCKPLLLLPSLLAADFDAFTNALKTQNENSYKTVVAERIDGGRNVVHLLVSIAALNADQHAFALKCTEALFASPWLTQCHVELLSHVDSCGRVPLMAAVQEQQYDIAYMLLNVVSQISNAVDRAGAMKSTAQRHNQVTGQTLLHALTTEELCSYDRTGPTHVSQDVFECHTCGLVEEYCLCFACASYCHLGHDVRYKGRAPSAYCDCKDRKCCVSFKLGNFTRRTAFADKCIECPALTTQTNFEGETPLYSLVTQNTADASFGRNCSPPNQPALNKELTERKRILLLLARNWAAVKATILMGWTPPNLNLNTTTNPNLNTPHNNTTLYANNSSDITTAPLSWPTQDNTVQLDGFTFHLLAKQSETSLTEIMRTIKTALKTDAATADDVFVASRFVRSAVRVFSILSSGEAAKDTNASDGLSASSSSKSSATPTGEDSSSSEYVYTAPRLERCRKIFKEFPGLAIQELAENSDAVIAPVRIGIVRAHGSFKLEQTAADKVDNRNRYKYPTTDPNEVFSPYIAGCPPSKFVRKQREVLNTAANTPPNDTNTNTTNNTSNNTNYNDDDTNDVVMEMLEHAHDVGDAVDMDVTPSDSNDALDTEWAIRSFTLKNATPTSEAAKVSNNPREMHHRASDYAAYVSRSARPRPTPVETENVEDEANSMDYLSRLFSRLVKEMVDVAMESNPADTQQPDAPTSTETVKETSENQRIFRHACNIMDMQLERCWNWLAPALDAIEAQLRCGTKFNLLNPSATASKLDGANTSKQDASASGGGGGGRKPTKRPATDTPPVALGQLGFRQYVLSLMRAHSGEHGDCLPELDVSHTKHLAHVLDAFFYYLRVKYAQGGLESLVTSASRHDQFFLRSDSIVESGAVAAPVFTTPFKEALPLADRPDRLHPSSSKSSLFGGARASENSTPPAHMGLSSRLSGSYRDFRPSVDLGISSPAVQGRAPMFTLDTSLDSTMSHAGTPSLDEIAPDALFERWKLVVGLFIKMFLDEVGTERESFLVKLSGFKVKEARFREGMEKLIRSLPESSSSDLKLTGLSRERIALLAEVYSKFESQQHSRRNKPLSFLCRAIKVDFKGEPGEGSGVVRGFLATLAEALLSPEVLPENKPNEKHRRLGAPALVFPTGANLTSSSTSSTDPSHLNPLRPLFHAPGKPGYVTPVFCANDVGDFRLKWFQYVGVLIGLSILHQHILPMNFSRHVLKFLLGRKIGWHDLAFFDPTLFESMRKTIVEATTAADSFASWDLRFNIDLPTWLGGASHTLIPNGETEKVTQENVHQYVALYAQYVMVDCVRPALAAMRTGLLSVVSEVALKDLTAEDLRLLLNGCSDVDIRMLKKCTTFKNETGKDLAMVNQTRDWFWEVLQYMSTSERHDLVYFWTSSPSLPATEAGFVPKPSIVVRPPSEGHAGNLPTANTCTARLSIPAYPSMEILKSKLLVAIKVKTFGFV